MEREELLFRIATKYMALSKSEKKVADFIKNFNGKAEKLTMKKVAKEAGVSEPSIMRFSKSIGLDGFNELKYCLMKTKKDDEGTMKPLHGFDINREDTIDMIPGKIVMTVENQINSMLESISLKSYSDMINCITKARNVDIYSVENSVSSANDLATKLLYLGINVKMYTDSYLQKISAYNLTSEDVAIGISYSGNSKDTVEMIKTAKKRGATTVVITNYKDSKIVKYADILICTSSDQMLYGDAIFSRAIQLVINDMIYMGIIHSDYDKYIEILNKNEKAIRSRGY